MSGELKKEMLGIGLVGVFLFLLVALISYNPLDVSLSTVSTEPVKNLCGKVGSYIADALVQLFGMASYLLPAYALLFSAFYIRKKTPQNPIVLASGLILLFLSIVVLLQLIVGNFHLKGILIPFTGMLGVLLQRTLVGLFSHFGSYLIAVMLFLISIFLIVQAPILSIIENGIARKRSVEKRKEIKVKEDKKEEPPKPVEKKPVQESFEFLKELGPYRLPPISLLDPIEKRELKIDKESIQANASILEKKLKDYGIEGRVSEVSPGPVITMYEFEPAPGIKVSRISNLEDDLAMALSAVSIRIIAPIPGKSVVGIEVPNKIRQTVYFREIIESKTFESSHSFLTLAVGKTISGEPFVAELAKMPHLLVAGSTGSGKSVSLNSMICSILFKATPTNVKFLMIDLKMLELSFYDGIPHLLLPVVTNAKNAKTSLRWLIDEMERRYTMMSELGVRNIDKYNQKMVKQEQDPIPYIVVVIDELADLMMTSTKEVEEYIARLAQMARASGIHLILATQRPSVDVLTGIIKANFPARISCKVFSKVDSRTILDTNGAESLLGYGDMLFLSPGISRLQRLHGPFVSEGEIKRIVEFLKGQGTPTYHTEILEEHDDEQNGNDEIDDEKYKEAVEFVVDKGEASISMVQRRFRIGYNRAARIVERMEKEGIVGPSDGVKPREVLKRQ
ncbi:MAG TPA: DNA translocase FtsK 4TM domain-containing protein [Syntrophorhabdaceae bacterium]|jgi:S-DNA-T family DNA segregation ATPase FtsK/SpoIIIE|nr:DNA translocase FtsK 4TM domain-containing protein [Syntrophorhabdaceae bacterium]MDI9560757.1 DNA translocase FtsK 4TM domain-containing protein [Pseudomonadota bacterium]OQC47205.1 MAG: DNA translocase FtsK [Deltaproteobacteria bacterium ADurb.Bin026]MBP8698984.1 DNA translocase FtsK 4TM domain-containing protein [Syntrophorhabdaceae bacterium]HNZ59585.1 DNA translocase FtsK 4TM domain-containing protein [Syntrophorhabdaceae bacterium]